MIEEAAQEILILHGIPASGKSSYALDLITKNPNFKKISRDDFRMMLDNYSHNPALENVINKMIDSAIKTLLKAGYSLVIDNTNLRESYIKDILKIRDKINSSMEKIWEKSNIKNTKLKCILI